MGSQQPVHHGVLPQDRLGDEEGRPGVQLPLELVEFVRLRLVGVERRAHRKFGIVPAEIADQLHRRDRRGALRLHVRGLQPRQPGRAVPADGQQGADAEPPAGLQDLVQVALRVKRVQVDQHLLRPHPQAELLDALVSLEGQQPHGVVRDGGGKAALHHPLELPGEKLQIRLQLLRILLGRYDFNVIASRPDGFSHAHSTPPALRLRRDFPWVPSKDNTKNISSQ